MDNRLQKDIRDLLSALLEQELSDSNADLIRAWYSENENRGLKDWELKAVFERVVRESEPDPLTVKKYSELAGLLGLSNSENPVSVKKAEVRPLRRRLAFRIAAAMVSAAVLMGIVYTTTMRTGVVDDGHNGAPALITLTATDGASNDFILPDGSKVSLAGATSLSYAEDFAANRQVKLSGEAFFSVARDENSPFSVETEKLMVRVLGTEFNLAAYPGGGETVVSLASGKVEVLEKDGSEAVTLVPLESFIYENTTGRSEVAEFDAEQIDIWKKIRTRAIENAALTDALHAACDFYGVNLSVEGNLPAARQVTIKLRESESLEDVLEGLRFMTEGFDYDINGNEVTIKARR